MRYFNRQEVTELGLLTESEIIVDAVGDAWRHDPCIRFVGVLLEETRCENVFDISLVPLFNPDGKRIFNLEDILMLNLITESEVQNLKNRERFKNKFKLVGKTYVDGNFQDVFEVLDLDLKSVLTNKTRIREEMWQQNNL